MTQGDVASALRWWRDAGVDTMIDEAPRHWLAKTVASPPALRVPEAGSPENEFATRDALVAWLMTAADVPDAGPPRRRLGPAGDPASRLMVLTDLPDLADLDAGKWFGGDQGTLFDNMLKAIGHSRDTVYLASISPGRPPSGRLSDAAFAALKPVALRHIALVAPKQLWLLGMSASRAILGMGDAPAHGKLHDVNLDDVMIEAAVTAHPRFLTDKDRKARAWGEMQRLIAKDPV